MEKRHEETEVQKNRRKRFKIAEELYTTEEAYYSTLTLINDTFRNRLKDVSFRNVVYNREIVSAFLTTYSIYFEHKLHFKYIDIISYHIP